MVHNLPQSKHDDGTAEEQPNIIRGAENFDLDEIKAALARNPDCINETSRVGGVTALHIAAADGNYDIVDFLCNQPGVDIAVYDAFGRTPTLLARAIGRPDIAERIMRDTAAECERLADLDDANAASQELADQDTSGTITPLHRRPS